MTIGLRPVPPQPKPTRRKPVQAIRQAGAGDRRDCQFASGQEPFRFTVGLFGTRWPKNAAAREAYQQEVL